MLRVGRRVSHSPHVDKESIESYENVDHRLMISFRFKGKRRKKQLCVILKNPSSAQKYVADATVRRVQDVLYKLFPDVMTVHLFNLFTLRGVEPSDLNNIYFKNKEMYSVLNRDMDDLLEKKLKQSSYVIFGWGGANGINKELYDNRIAEVKHLVIDHFDGENLYRIVGDRLQGNESYPLHGQVWDTKMRKICITMRF